MSQTPESPSNNKVLLYCMITGIVSILLSTLAAYWNITDQVTKPTIGVEIQDEKPDIIAPASPGLVAAEEICKLGNTVKTEREGGTYYTVQHGMSILEWPGSLKIGLVDGIPVVLSDEVISCLEDK